ncbi:MAG: TIGR03087 family PEP-CTERM/XrtA system glycosyltransferase [Candidatus Korobacteraceae bacterium]
MQILFLAHRLPYPPDKGERIRAFEELRYLGERHRVDLFCFADSVQAAEQQKFLAAMCRSVHVEVLNRRSRLLRAATNLVSGRPISFGFFYSPAFQRKVHQALYSHNYDAAFVYSSSMGQYIPRPAPVPVVVDFVDADSHKFQQYAASSHGVHAWFYRREATRVEREERSLGRLAALSLAVTEHDARGLQNSIGSGVRVEVVPNGVYVPEDRDAQPQDLSRLRPFLLFVGTMSYPPNEDAVLYFADCILPLVRKTFPEMSLVVVGREPGRRVRALASRPGIVVTGSVPDPFLYFRNAEASVAPFRISQGFHNKIAESLAVGTPVIASSRAKAGIGLSEGEGLFAADTPDEFATTIARAVNPELRRKLRQNVAAVRETLNWNGRLDSMDRLLVQAVIDGKEATCELVQALES